MKTCNKLVRDNVAELLKSQGYQEIKGKKLKGEKYKAELYSLFLQEYKDALVAENQAQLQVHYADMLEVIRTLMVATKTKIHEIDFGQNQVIEWYKNSIESKNKLVDARIDLLQKFYELLKMKTEAIRDQLGDLLISFKQLVESNKFSFVQIEQVRRNMFKKLGGFNKGIYLVSVSKTQTHTV